MRFTKITVLLTAVLFCGARVDHVLADTFGSGPNTFDIAFVDIGNPGNPADTTGSPNPAGSVAYSYRIGKYEISEQMIAKANLLGGLNIVASARGADKPATNVNWFEAAVFINWLNSSSGSLPAYKFDGGGNFQLWSVGDIGYDPNNPYRNSLARYFLPSVDEWYKAAFYDPANGVYYEYPTGSNSPPVAVSSGTLAGTAVYLINTVPADITLAGGLSPFGTMAQGGNVWEWEETEFDLLNDSPQADRGLRGGDWNTAAGDLSSLSRYNLFPSYQISDDAGFRVASLVIPEPGALLLGMVAGVVCLLPRGRRT